MYVFIIYTHIYIYSTHTHTYTHTHIYIYTIRMSFWWYFLSNLMDDWMALDTHKGQIHSTEPLGSGFLVVLSENSLHFLLAAARLGVWVRILCPLKSRKSLKLNGFTMVHLYTRYRILNTQFFVQLVPDFAASGCSNRPWAMQEKVCGGSKIFGHSQTHSSRGFKSTMDCGFSKWPILR